MALILSFRSVELIGGLQLTWILETIDSDDDGSPGRGGRAKMRRFLIDTDTASDDAVALVMALRHPDVHVEAITVVAGNVPLQQGVQNALYVVELCGRTDAVPVHTGLAKPLLRPLRTAQFCHGNDGFGDIGLDLSGRVPSSDHAVDVIIRTIRRFPQQITLVTLGPLTNVAVALLRDPGIAALVDRCIVMGGIGFGHGNVVPAAEYNLWVDPEAAKIVFESGLPITMVGWDVSHQSATFTHEQAQHLRSLSGLAAFCVDIQRSLRDFGIRSLNQIGFDLPDPMAMAVALEPDVATRVERLHVAVETTGELTRGATVIDHLRNTENEPNVDVVLAACRERFLDLVTRSLQQP